MALIDVIHSKVFSIIFSILLGLSLASFFKYSCKGKSCIIHKAPNPQEITNGVYKFDDSCYKFNTNVANCNSDAVTT